MIYGPDTDGLSWNARTEDSPEDMITVMFLGVFEDLPVEAKMKVMEGALEGLNAFFAKKKPAADVQQPKHRKETDQ